MAEGVRAAIATYTHALDDGRTDDVVATFCPDGFCDMPGLGRHEGHDALREAYGEWKPVRPQRHLVLNTVVTEWDDGRGAGHQRLRLLVEGRAGVGAWSSSAATTTSSTATATAWRFHSRVAEFSA